MKLSGWGKHGKRIVFANGGINLTNLVKVVSFSRGENPLERNIIYHPAYINIHPFVIYFSMKSNEFL
ncbi:hypothetical protein J18TS1_02720 [Oceanobacillus oncorhynchi subsp. incaldanensis]|nr:hypothetical protein J18TS1_02720 [Oceanobacillus oncorhynchi subsp. incaldanensis]